MSIRRNLLIANKQKSKNIPLTFTAIETSGATIKLTSIGTPNDIFLKYKINDSLWKKYTINLEKTLNLNDKISFKSTTTKFSIGNYRILSI